MPSLRYHYIGSQRCVSLYPLCRPPFTIQRLCELILEPNKHYRSRRVFVRAVEKVCCTPKSLSHLSSMYTHTCTFTLLSQHAHTYTHPHKIHIHMCIHNTHTNTHYNLFSYRVVESFGSEHSRTRPHVDEESKVVCTTHT